jgi:hypothetical protein
MNRIGEIIAGKIDGALLYYFLHRLPQKNVRWIIIHLYATVKEGGSRLTLPLGAYIADNKLMHLCQIIL